MLYRVLGTLVVEHDGQLVRVPGGYARAVFAALLIRANRPVSATELLRVAWGDAETSRQQLDKRIVEVRSVLESVGRRDQLVTVRGLGYELRAQEEELDALRFERLTIRADEAKAAGRPDEEVATLRSALDLWQGPHVAANTDNEQLATLARSIEERRRRVAVRLFELEFGLGRFDAVLSRLAAIAGDYPTDARLCELLMIAHHRCGDPAAANRAFLAHERALDEELGAAPVRALRDLNYAISAGEEQHIRTFEAAVATKAGSERRIPATTPRQLPPPPADFVGRGDPVAEAVWLLRRAERRSAPVIVAAGQGGAGKTALALHVAHQVVDAYPDGQVIASLRGSTDTPATTDDVVAGFLRALGVTAVPEASADRVSMYRSLAADRAMLIVLDDAYDEEQVRDLIPGGPRCAVIITARRRLPDVDGVHHLPSVGVLEPEDSRALFHAVVRRSRIDLPPATTEVDQVVALCASLPLALRIAAAQYVRDHPRPLAELVERLSRHGTDAIEYGPRSVAGSLGSGFERLDGPARQLLLGLGLTRLVEFELWTAAAILDGTGADPAAALSALVDYHMVEPVGDQDRYRFHDLTRDYVGRRAGRELPPQDRDDVAGRVYAAVLGLARMAHRRLVGGDFEVVHSSTPDWAPRPELAVPGDEKSAWDWFERERTNIRAAVEHCAEVGLTEICWDLAFTAHEFYGMGRYFDDWRTVQTIALQACQAAQDQRGEALMLVGLGQPTLVASRPASGVSGPTQLARAIDLLTASEDWHGLAIAERTLANALRRRGQLDAPLQLFLRALEHYESSDDALGRWQTLRFIGHTHLDRGDVTAALELLTRAQSAAEGLGRAYPLAQTSYWKGQAHLAAGDVESAASALQPLFDAFASSTSGTGLAYSLHARGQLSLRSGGLAAAEEHLQRAAALAAQVADATLEGRVQLSLAEAYHRLGQERERVGAVERAADCFASGDAVYLQATALSILADVRLAAGDQAGADAAWHRVERLYDQMGLPEADRVQRGIRS